MGAQAVGNVGDCYVSQQHRYWVLHSKEELAFCWADVNRKFHGKAVMDGKVGEGRGVLS